MNLKNLPKWDLTDFYQNIEDKNIILDFQNLKEESKLFAKNYQGKIDKLSGDELYQAIKKNEQIAEQFGKISSFAYLNYAADMLDEKNTAFYQNSSEKIREISKDLVFFEIEINEITEEDLQKLYDESQNLQKYQPHLRDIRVFKKHQLKEEIEKILLEKSSTGASAWNRLFDETINNLKFPYDKKELNSSEIFNLLSSKDAITRKKSAKIIGDVLGQNIRLFSFITNILAKDKDINDNLRNFERPISSRNLNNFIEDKIVDNLVEVVKDNYSNISHRYYKIKAKLLGLDKMHYSDRNAPLSMDENLTSWEDAKEIVFTSYNNFSPKLAEIGQRFFDNDWIDVGVRDGKDSGAFAHPTVPSIHPYLLLNYQGKVRDIMTLAHELGHGVHQILASQKGYFMSGTPLTLAETASVFGEQLTFQEILKREQNPERKKIIIASKVEDMINTVIRQIAFLEFERKVHDERKKGEISSEKLCQFWMEVQKDSLGDIFTFDDEYKYYWSYIPHFIHSPFYVYSYAFGDCLVNSLYGAYKNGLPNFEEKYLEMLKAGGTLHHKELLAPFGLDASRKEFWQFGLDVIADYIDQLEK
ncbi:M3 family oligoendopeptidase [Rickettsiales bacterium]|nr:M3 family oligoendopeptidase [Rickettsiales bacterium]MDB2550350.1 M3 family oligoendopeptidase [Rickettsiales bacterium]